MSKISEDEQLIMVIKRELLFGKNDEYSFQGFMKKNRANYEARVLRNWESLPRKDAEYNGEYKQIIPYLVMLNPIWRKIFSYQRATETGEYLEQRLHGKCSVGVGGHIKTADAKCRNMIYGSMRKTTREEIGIDIFGVKSIGAINDDSDSVGRVHFGLVYLIEIHARKINAISKALKNGKFENIGTLLNQNSLNEIKLENWSKMILENMSKTANFKRKKGLGMDYT